MNTDTILIDSYDRYSQKVIKGITPVNTTNYILSILKDYRDQWQLHKLYIHRLENTPDFKINKDAESFNKQNYTNYTF